MRILKPHAALTSLPASSTEGAGLVVAISGYRDLTPIERASPRTPRGSVP